MEQNITVEGQWATATQSDGETGYVRDRRQPEELGQGTCWVVVFEIVPKGVLSSTSTKPIVSETENWIWKNVFSFIFSRNSPVIWDGEIYNNPVSTFIIIFLTSSVHTESQ